MLEKKLFPEDLNLFVKEGGKIIGVDVDTQKDFADKNGALFVEAEDFVRQNIQKLSKSGIPTIGSVDSHSYDAWEFQENGGPFPAHCIKGTEGWLKISETQDSKTRFIPMSQGNLEIGENISGTGNRKYDELVFADEVLKKGVQGIFEKEVYSAFENPNAEKFIAQLIETTGGVKNAVFAVYGYATGNYCVDAFAKELAEKGYKTAIIEDATAPINIGHQGESQNGQEITRNLAKKFGIKMLQTADILNALK